MKSLFLPFCVFVLVLHAEGPSAATAVEIAPASTERLPGKPLDGSASSSLSKSTALSLASDLATLVPGGRVGVIGSGGRMWPALDSNTVVIYQLGRLEEMAPNDLVIFDDFRGNLSVSRLVHCETTYAIARPDNVRGPIAATRLIPAQVRGRVVAQFQYTVETTPP